MGNVLNTCLRSGGGGLLVGGMGTSILSVLGSKLAVRELYVDRNMVGIAEGEADVVTMG